MASSTDSTGRRSSRVFDVAPTPELFEGNNEEERTKREEKSPSNHAPLHPTFFSPSGSGRRPTWLPRAFFLVGAVPPSFVFTSLILILLLTGQCPNPGPPPRAPKSRPHLQSSKTPKYPCSVCGREARTGYLCRAQDHWVHIGCSGIRNEGEYRANPTWACPSCASSTSLSPPPNQPSRSPLPSSPRPASLSPQPPPASSPPPTQSPGTSPRKSPNFKKCPNCNNTVAKNHLVFKCASCHYFYHRKCTSFGVGSPPVG